MLPSNMLVVHPLIPLLLLPLLRMVAIASHHVVVVAAHVVGVANSGMHCTQPHLEAAMVVAAVAAAAAAIGVAEGAGVAEVVAVDPVWARSAQLMVPHSSSVSAVVGLVTPPVSALAGGRVQPRELPGGR
jgi:hypothetical protein